MSDQKFLNHRDMHLKANPARAAAPGDPARKPGNDQRGSDPYNTSGSFDRKKHWARVGKR